MNRETVNGVAVNLVHLLAPTLSVTQASSDQLQERIQSTIRAQNQAAAIRAEALAELRRREGSELTESVLREDGLLGRRQARSELETAQELEKLPETRKGFRRGDISYDNARIIAGASQRGDIDEEELAELATAQSPDKFAGTVRRHEKKRSEDDGDSRLKHQRSRRFARIKTETCVCCAADVTTKSTTTDGRCVSRRADVTPCNGRPTGIDGEPGDRLPTVGGGAPPDKENE